MLDRKKKYPGKLLLFGEYLVIDGGEALALPLPRYYGHWSSADNITNPLPENLYEYLKSQEYDRATIEIDKLSWSRKSKIVFKSSIKTGYGNGSSGALSAAIYDQFFIKNGVSIKEDRINLSTIESFFQGTSSGIDPLVCYHNTPIHITKDQDIVVNVQITHNKLQNWYLLDSKVARNTEKLVEIYKRNKQIPEYASRLSLLKTINNELVDRYISYSKEEAMWNHLRAFSQLQYEMFDDMILDHIKDFWQQGLQSEVFCMKLCGAGGGGYYLVYIFDSTMMQSQFHNLWNQLIPIVNVPS